MTAFMVMAVATVGVCGSPVCAGEGAISAPAGMGPGGAQMGAPAATSGAQTAAQDGGLTISPGGGYGSPGGGGSGSPTLLLSELGVKNQFISVQRASYVFPIPKMQSGIRIMGDAVNNNMTVSGRYGQAGTGADLRLGDNLDVAYNAGLYNLQVQLDYSPIAAAKTLKVGPSVGFQYYADTFEVTDLTNPALSSSATHNAQFFTIGAWGELGLPDMLRLAGARAQRIGEASPLQPRLYLAAVAGFGKDWTSFNWEAMLSVFTVNKNTVWTGSRFGKYLPMLRTDIGYIAYYFTQAHQDQTSLSYVNPIVTLDPAALQENVKTDFGAWVVRANLAF